MKMTLSDLSNSNIAALAERVITTSDKPEYTVVENNPLLLKLKAEFTNYFAAFGKKAYSGMGNSVLEADMRRDAPFSGFKSILLGYSKFDGYELQQDAIDLYNIIENRGLKISTYNYAEQSAEMDKLIEELDQPQNTAKLMHLNLTVPYEILKTAQSNFKILFSTQASINGQLHQKQTASSIRKNIEKALRNYMSIVDAMQLIDGWSQLNAELNELVKASNNSNTTKQTTPPIPAN